MIHRDMIDWVVVCSLLTDVYSYCFMCIVAGKLPNYILSLRHFAETNGDFQCLGITVTMHIAHSLNI